MNSALKLAVSIIFLFALGTACSSAATLGYWRFEPGATTVDESPNQFNLHARGTNPVDSTLPGAGPGADFPDTLSQNGFTNTQASSLGGGAWWETVDSAGLFAGDELTIELFFHATDPFSSTPRMLVAKQDNITKHSWFLAVRNDQLCFSSSENGTAPITLNSTFPTGSLVEGADYHASVFYQQGSVTFQLANLSGNGSNLTSTVNGFAPTLFRSDSNLKIGAYDANDAGSRWSGLIDEVRISDRILAENELLTSVPETNATQGYTYLAADSVSAPDIPLLGGKRIPFGWPAMAVDSSGPPSHLTWAAASLPPGKDVRLRLAVALDIRQDNPSQRTELVIRRPISGCALGRMNLTYSPVFQISEITLARADAERALIEGLDVVQTEGNAAVRVFGPTSDMAVPTVLQPHFMCAGTTDPWAGFLERSLSVDTIQPFGWMEGCLLDGLYDYAGAFTNSAAATALQDRLDLYLVGTNGYTLDYESPNSHALINYIYGIEGTLPFAAIALTRPAHPRLQTAVDFWLDHVRTGAVFAAGSIIDPPPPDKITSEGSYTVGWPLLVIARQRADPELEAIALDQLRVRQTLLADYSYGTIYQQRNDSGWGSNANWARGITWYYLGLVRCLAELPASRTDVDDLRTEAVSAMNLVLSHQRANGLWGNFIDDPDSLVDTSGSAGIAAALAIGHAHGILPEQARTAAENAVAGLSAYLTPDGLLAGGTSSNRGYEIFGDRREIFPLGMGLTLQLLAALEVSP